MMKLRKVRLNHYPNSGYYYNEDSWQTGITEVYNDNGDAKFRPLTVTRHENIRSDTRRDLLVPIYGGLCE